MTNLSPLQPTKRKNLKEYREFRNEVKGLIKDYTENALEIKRANPLHKIENSDTLQRVYSHGLELLLAEASQEEKKLTQFQELTGAIGITPDDSAWINAILSHVVKTVNIPENAETLINRVVGETGFSYQNKDFILDETAYLVLNTKKDAEKLGYVVRLLGYGEFSEKTKSRANTIALDCLGDGNFKTYDIIKESIKEITISENIKKSLSHHTKSLATSLRFYEIKEIEKRVPGSFSESDALETGVNFLKSFKFSEYNRLCDEFKLGEYNESQKEKIRAGAIEYLKQNPTYYTMVRTINDKAKISIKATKEELREVINSYFNKNNNWDRKNPLDVAKALNQELDPEQISERYIKLIKEHIEDNNFEKKMEAVKIFENTNIPVDPETCKEIIRLKRLDDKLNFLNDFNSIGYKVSDDEIKELYKEAYNKDNIDIIERIESYLNRKPGSQDLELLISTNGNPKKKMNWIIRLKPKYKLSISKETGDKIYRELIQESEISYKDIHYGMNSIGFPPEDVANRMVLDSLERTNLGLSESVGWNFYYLNEIIVKLRENNLVKLNQEQTEEVLNSIKQKSSLKEMVNKMKNAEKFYGVKPIFNEKDQRIILEVINESICNQAYTAVKRQSADYLNNSKYIAGSLTDEIKNEAKERLNQLLIQGDIYQGFYYSILTDTKPSLSREHYQSVLAGFNKYQRRFGKLELEHFTKMLESWKQEGGEI